MIFSNFLIKLVKDRLQTDLKTNFLLLTLQKIQNNFNKSNNKLLDKDLVDLIYQYKDKKNRKI